MSHSYSCFVALQYFFIASRESEKVRKGRKRSLLQLCIGGNRTTATVKSNYRLFCEVLGKKEVPIALAVTHLEREAVMEDWRRNGKSLDKNGIHSTGHACITTLDTTRFPFHDHNADNGIHSLRGTPTVAFPSVRPSSTALVCIRQLARQCGGMHRLHATRQWWW